MSKIANGQISIYEALQNINNGKYVMPVFQRQYVWSMEQIEKLWDSILLDYPIATFLLWHLDDDNVSWDTYFCNFLPKVIFDNRKKSDSTNYELTSIDISKTDTAILDGQQRLTSLYISLFGEAHIRQKYSRRKSFSTYNAKLVIELNEKRVDVVDEEYNTKKFDIKFTEKVGKLSPTQFDIKRILNDDFKNLETRNMTIDNAIANVPTDSKEYAREILKKLCSKIYDEKLINYTEIFNMNEDDALEMFVRFNSGGKPLRKSEITMSIIEAYWAQARTEFGKLLQGKYERFGTDFIIRTALMLFGDVVKSNINKEIVDCLKNEWTSFKKALTNLDILLNEFKMNVAHFASGWNVLLPIIYVIYNNPNYKQFAAGFKSYLMRAIFFNYFRSGTTSKLQQMKTNINAYNFEINTEMLEQISDLRVTEGKIEDILNAEKGSRVAGEVLYYLSLDWVNENLNHEEDHLHPYDRFDEPKPPVVTFDDWNQWRSLRNRLPNLQYFEGRENASKNSMSLFEYYTGKTDDQKNEFRKMAIIPDNVSLEIKDFGDFYEKRKELLRSKIKALLS